MAWIEPSNTRSKDTRWRLRENIEGRRVTVISDLGSQKKAAQGLLVKFEDAVAAGYKFAPPVLMSGVIEWLEAAKQGRYLPNSRRIKMKELCALYLQYPPELKGGKSDHYTAPYHLLKLRVAQLCAFPIKDAHGNQVGTWGEMWADEITLYHVRDYLAQFETAGTKLRHIGSLGAMFNAATNWNLLKNVLPYQIRLPEYNPFKAWRSQMPKADKLELPDERVLEQDEWGKFKVHLTTRARAICEIMLRRFLRKADVKNLTELSKVGKNLEGEQAKTGMEFLVPEIKGGPSSYDFTNFMREFKQAQVKAGMDFPADHPKHFSPKDLRRTGATWAYRGGKAIEDISAMLGHKSIKTTQRYLRIRIEDVQPVADLMDALADGRIKFGKVVENKAMSGGTRAGKSFQSTRSIKKSGTTLVPAGHR